MRNRQIARIAAALTIGAAVAAGTMPAHAGFNGHTVGAQLFRPDLATPLAGVTPATAIVGAGFEFTFGFTRWDLADTTILTTFTGLSSVPAAAFNGVRFEDVNATIADIVGVTINSTNMAGFDASRVTFNANQIFINYQGLSFNQSTVVLLDVQFAQQAPEPATGALLVLGLGGLALLRRRRTT